MCCCIRAFACPKLNVDKYLFTISAGRQPNVAAMHELNCCIYIQCILYITNIMPATIQQKLKEFVPIFYILIFDFILVNLKRYMDTHYDKRKTNKKCYRWSS